MKPAPCHQLRNARRAFTLFEVGICLALAGLSILTLILVLPAGIKVQQSARFRIYAAAKAMDMAEQMMTFANFQALKASAPGGDKNATTAEAKLPWDTNVAYRAYAPDWEVRLATIRGGLLPLPDVIARRIDSSNNEIKNILDQGGQLYYGNPLPSHGLKAETSFEVKPPSESIRLIMGVVGYAQQNAITRFPWKDWPYYAPYPSPPMTGDVSLARGPWEALDDPDCGYVWNHDFGSWDGTGNFPFGGGTRRSGFHAYCGGYSGANSTSAYRGWDRGPDGIGPNPPNPNGDDFWENTPPESNNWALNFGPDGVLNPPNTTTSYTGDNKYESGGLSQFRDAQINYGEAPWLAAKHYFALALWYAYKKGIPISFITGTATSAEVESYGDNVDVVRAVRYLAHAATCMTRQYALEATAALPARSEWRFSSPGQQSMQVNLEAWPPLQGLRTGVAIPGNEPVTFGGTAAPRPTSLLDLFDGDLTMPSAAGALPAVSISVLAPAPAGHPDPLLPGNFYLTHNMIVNYHETCLKLIMRWSARNPYNWSLPRPINRAIMMDFPLLQFDTFSPPFTGTITGTASDPRIPGGPIAASMWRPISAQPIVNLGYSSHRWQVGDFTAGIASDTPATTNIWGNPAHFSLTAPFDARERCRQLVFWMVDWTGFEDWETAPSAPVDASKYPRLAPQLIGENVANSFTTEYMGQLNNQYGNPSVAFYERFQPLTRNPEKIFLLKRDVQTWETGSNIRPWTMGLELHGSGQTDAVTIGQTNNDRWDWGGYFHPANAASRPSDSDPRAIFSGLYGADRNWNQILDRGPLPRSARIRAIEVSRFNIYDPRLEIQQR